MARNFAINESALLPIQAAKRSIESISGQSFTEDDLVHIALSMVTPQQITDAVTIALGLPSDDSANGEPPLDADLG